MRLRLAFLPRWSRRWRASASRSPRYSATTTSSPASRTRPARCRSSSMSSSRGSPSPTTRGRTSRSSRPRSEIMQVQSDSKPYDDINITPMLDLAYVLLVIFIIMTTATVQGMKVNLPTASKMPSLAQQTTKAITINNDGKIFLDTIPVTLPELEQRLIQQRALTPDFPVVVRGDGQTQYQSRGDVLDLLAR